MIIYLDFNIIFSSSIRILSFLDFYPFLFPSLHFLSFRRNEKVNGPEKAASFTQITQNVTGTNSTLTIVQIQFCTPIFYSFNHKHSFLTIPEIKLHSITIYWNDSIIKHQCLIYMYEIIILISALKKLKFGSHSCLLYASLITWGRDG
jgi:hypothetical protein